MDAKDLRTEAAPSDRSNDGNSKYGQGGGALPCHRNKTYQDMGSNSLAKVDSAPSRPCAVIGPDRVVPPAPTDSYYKKGLSEPWLTSDNTYRRPPEYPHKLLDYQLPSRNISPRQTFQENMQRIMVPPTYNTGKLKEDHNFPAESNMNQIRNKLSVPSDSNTKYCDVPYTVSPLHNDPKNVRNPDINLSNMSNVVARGGPQAWPPSSSNILQPKPVHQDLCQYPEYQNYAAPRPMVMTRPHRSVHEDPGAVYADGYYHNGNIRFKPYPAVRERYPQSRYEYYSNPFHPPPPFPTHKYDLQKQIPPHPYPSYQQVPFKYLDSRMADPIMNGYQRSLNQQAAYGSMPYQNQVIHSAYGPVPGNCLPSNKYYPYPPDAIKSMPSNKLPFDPNSKLLPEYENRSKNYPVSEPFYINEITRHHATKGPVLPPNYPTNIHAMPTHPYYRKDSIKGYENSPHFRHMDHMVGINNNLMSRFPSQFSPSAITISPSDSNTSNETYQTQGVSHEDCGYVSQSSTASARSMDLKYDQRYGHVIKNPAPFSKQELTSYSNSKDRKNINVRQFLQMWNEGEDEGGEGNNKEIDIKSVPNSSSNINAANCGPTNQEQLYVLGLVNVPSEELGKYQHIQKVSKLPENIKGYNSIELLHQFEEVIESSNLNQFYDKTPAAKTFHNSFTSTVPMHAISIPSRPLSPLDVEAKISQSVIHKEVGCNFEIKPCSPKMLNVEVAKPIQTVIGERTIEKISNPLIGQSPIPTTTVNESREVCNSVKPQSLLSIQDNTKITSCKMIHKPFGNKEFVDPVKTNYSIQDLESNSGVCLASLPRLDNDIELNFPEVNQQFINANKVESVITGPIKEFPALDTNKIGPIHCEPGKNVDSHGKRNSENDFSKLSKYRKNKRKNSAPNTPDSSVRALRTDSVIIKNPENFKYENLEKPLSPKILRIEAQNDPINLSVNTENCVESAKLNSSEDKPNEFAIDFSTNSNEPYQPYCIKDPKMGSTGYHSLNRVNIETDQYKKVLSPICVHDGTDGGNHQIENENAKPDTPVNDFKMTSLDKESLQSIENVDISISTSPKHSQKIIANKIIENTENDVNSPLQNCNVTNEESLNRKLSRYNFLSSQEKEDTLNEKMRELFGEEFSTVETDPGRGEPHVTQSVFEDNSVERDCIFSDDDEMKNKSISKRASSDYCFSDDLVNKESEATTTCQKEISENGNITSREENTHEKNYNGKQFVTKHKSDNIGRNVKRASLNDLNSCVNAQKENGCHIKKELLSPWIQKLILHAEGSLTSLLDSKQLKEANVEDKFKKDIGCAVVIKCDDNTPDQNAIINYTHPNTGKGNIKINELGVTYTQILNDREKKTTADQKCLKLASNVSFVSRATNELETNILKKDTKHQKHMDANREVTNTQETSTFARDYMNLETDVCTVDFYTTSNFCDKLENHNDLFNNNTREQNKHKTSDSIKEYVNDGVLLKAVNKGDSVSRSNAISDVSYTQEKYNKLSRSPSDVLELSEGAVADALGLAECKFKIEDHTESIKINQKSSNVFENEISDLETLNVPESKNTQENYDILEASTCINIKKTVDNKLCCLENDDFLNAANLLGKEEKIESNEKLESCSIPEINDIKSSQKVDSCNCSKYPQSEENSVELFTKTSETLESSENDSSCVILGNETCNKDTEIAKKYKSDERTPLSDDITAVKSEIVIDIKSDRKNYNTGTLTVDTQSKDITNSCLGNIIDQKSNQVNSLCFNDLPKHQEETSNLPTLDMNLLNATTVDPEFHKECSMITIVNSKPAFGKYKENSLNSPSGPSRENRQQVFDNYNTKDIPKIFSSPTGGSPKNPKISKIDLEFPNKNFLTAGSDHPIVERDSENTTYVSSAQENETVDNFLVGNSFKSSLLSNQSIDTETMELDNIEVNTRISNQTSVSSSYTEESTSSSDESDESESSDEDDTSDSTDSIVSLNNTDSFEQENNICKEDKSVKSTAMTFTKDNATKGLTCINPNEDNFFDEDKKILDEESKKSTALNLITDNATEEHTCNIPTGKFVNEEEKKVDDDETKFGEDNVSSVDVDKIVYKENKRVADDKSANSTALTFSDDSVIEELPCIIPSGNVENLVNEQEKNIYEHDVSTKPTALSLTEENVTENYSCNIPSVNLDKSVHFAKDCDDQNDKYEEYDIYSFGNEPSPYEQYNDVLSPSQITAVKNIPENGSEDINTDNFSVGNETIPNGSSFILETSPGTKYDVIGRDECNEMQFIGQCENVSYLSRYLGMKRKSLKRSLSDSAINEIRDMSNEESSENCSLVSPIKRKKNIETNNYDTSQLIAQNICRVLQNNRRNSISSIQNEENVSFCILIDNNCIISEECDEPDKICFTEVTEDCLTCIRDDQEDASTGNIISIKDINCEYSNHSDINYEGKIIDEQWVEDVACVETVVTDDIGENIVISASVSPKEDEDNEEENEMYNTNEHTEKLKYIYGDKMYTDDANFVETLYRTPQMNVNQTLNYRESQINTDCNIEDDCGYYDKETLERVLCESNIQDASPVILQRRTPLPSPVISELSADETEKVVSDNSCNQRPETPLIDSEGHEIESGCDISIRKEYQDYLTKSKQDNANSCVSTINDAFITSKKDKEYNKNNISSSPEVSSTTTDDKKSCILLKITNCGGSMVSQVKDINPVQGICCKYTEVKDYLSSNGNMQSRTLLTKAAQKYIPPLTETIRDLKVKLPLPHQSLIKLKQLKLSNKILEKRIDKSANKFKKEFPKKPKPKFEDVLKSIDEIQFQKHKENNKKGKRSIPKVVIKKNEHGSHYASTSNKNPFNPDLTGRKWQPWVFLEKHNFIDKMALRKKTRAIFSHRKNSYVLADKFQKYKSVYNTKFIISQPKQDDSSSGQLKYTIRLKHNY